MRIIYCFTSPLLLYEKNIRGNPNSLIELPFTVRQPDLDNCSPIIGKDCDLTRNLI